MTAAPNPVQHLGELAAFLDYLDAQPSPPASYLEIGVWEGGTLAAFGARFPDAHRVGVDPAPIGNATEQSWIVVGRSQDSATQDAVRQIRDQWDVVFIDGAHDEDSCMQDFEFAVTLRPRWIAIHDVTNRSHPDIECWKVWDALVKYAPRMGRETVLFSQVPDEMGIGLIVMPTPHTRRGTHE